MRRQPADAGQSQEAGGGSSRSGGQRAAGWIPAAALFLASLSLRPAISSIAPVLELIRRDLGMGAFAASWLTAIPVLCMGFLSPVSIRLGHRFGLERVIACSLALIAGSTLLRCAARTSSLLLLTALLAGIGIATMGPLLSGFIRKASIEANSTTSGRSVPTMIAVYSMALSLGAALGSGLSAPLQIRLHSWQASLALWSVLAFVALPVWYGVARRQPGEAATPVRTSKLPWGNKTAWLLTIHFGLMSFVFYSLLGWLPPIMESAGYSHLYAGMLLTMFAIVQIPSGLVLRMLLRRFPSRLLWLLTASVLQLIGLIFILISALPWLAALLCGFGCGMLFALGTLLPIDAAANAQEAASWAAMTQSAGYLIGALGPMLIGWLSDATHRFSSAVLGLIVVTLMLVAVQLLVVPRPAKSALNLSIRR